VRRGSWSRWRGQGTEHEPPYFDVGVLPFFRLLVGLPARTLRWEPDDVSSPQAGISNSCGVEQPRARRRTPYSAHRGSGRGKNARAWSSDRPQPLPGSSAPDSGMCRLTAVPPRLVLQPGQARRCRRAHMQRQPNLCMTGPSPRGGIRRSIAEGLRPRSREGSPTNTASVMPWVTVVPRDHVDQGQVRRTRRDAARRGPVRGAASDRAAASRGPRGSAADQGGRAGPSSQRSSVVHSGESRGRASPP